MRVPVTPKTAEKVLSSVPQIKNKIKYQVTCPTDKLLPSSSMVLSNVKRGEDLCTSKDESSVVDKSREFDFRGSTR